jgi:hypothetical protein
LGLYYGQTKNLNTEDTEKNMRKMRKNLELFPLVFLSVLCVKVCLLSCARQAEIRSGGDRTVKLILTLAAIIVLTLVPSHLLLAQGNPFLGTWKLNPAKCKFTAGAPPKEETFTVQLVGDQDQMTANGTAADGSAITLKYQVPKKGGAGRILTGPFDGISAKMIDENTMGTSYRKGGKEIRSTQTVISKDGKTMSATIKGTDAQGKPASGVLVFEKQ